MRYLIEVWLADDAPSSFFTDDGEPLLVQENILEDVLREIRAGTGELGDWRDVAKLGDWKVSKILAHPVGEPRDVTQEPIPVPKSVNGSEVVVDSHFRSPDGTTYYACRWLDPDEDCIRAFLLIYDTVNVFFADGTMVDEVAWVGDR